MSDAKRILADWATFEEIISEPVSEEMEQLAQEIIVQRSHAKPMTPAELAVWISNAADWIMCGSEDE